MTDLKFLTTDEQRAEAYAAGADAARFAASWVDTSDPAKVLAMLEDGDPAAEMYLPAYPDLSGEWADAPTPASLAREILGDDFDPDAETELADAWEMGVSETFEPECERILREFVS